jgi:putative hydrolase of the HAD superfamily
MGIINYIFDFGDVFINLDKSATKMALQELGLEEFTEEMNSINKQYEKGLLTTDEFIAFYQTQFPTATHQELIDAWNSILLDFPEYRLVFIEEFSKTHNCYLLSNINDLHLEYIKNDLGTVFYNRFINCFKKVYYTHKIHLRKPDAAIFEFVFSDAQINPKESFFVDDTLENIEAAKEFGVTCWNINPLDDDIVLLEEILAFL